MRVQVTTPFHGKEEERLLRVGQIITVTQDRGERMIARGLGIIAPDLPEPKPKAKKRKKAKKPAEDKAQRPTEDKTER